MLFAFISCLTPLTYLCSLVKLHHLLIYHYRRGLHQPILLEYQRYDITCDLSQTRARTILTALHVKPRLSRNANELLLKKVFVCKRKSLTKLNVCLLLLFNFTITYECMQSLHDYSRSTLWLMILGQR